jgi:WhiB family redox-sensing transcriptional regulator
VTRALKPGEWILGAACAETDPEAFFPDNGGSMDRVKAVCGRCDVRERCLTEALERDEAFGIFGGLSAEARQRLKKGGAA